MTYRKAWWYIGVACATVTLLLLLAWKVGNWERGEIFSLGQLLVEAILLPAVIISFVMTAEQFRMATEQFREALKTPCLDLYWQTESGEIQKELEVAWPYNRGVRPVLVNNGQAVAVWYTLYFDVPLEILEGRRIGPQGRWHARVGKADNWRQEISGDKLHVAFLSNGAIASYPGCSLPLGVLAANVVVPVDEHPKEYRVPYAIFTERGHASEGFLLLRTKGKSV